MRRGNDSAAELPGQDSFLDIVANIVGILILLVMVVGVRASKEADVAVKEQAAPKPQPAVDEPAEETVRAAYAEAQTTQGQVADLVKRFVGVRQEALLRDEERMGMVTYLAAFEQELEERRELLDEQTKRDFDARRKLNEAQATLDEMTREQIALLSQAPEVEEVESLPTPLAQLVEGKRLHLRLHRGHVAYVPLEALMDEFAEHADTRLWELQDRNQTVVTVGPLHGFRLRIHVRKSRFAGASASGGTRQGWVTFPTLFELLPVSDQLGEPVEQAILPNSDLWQRLREHPPENWTITVWTYPGSFNEFRTLKRVLYEAGYATAGRPLPEGKLIAGSPNGTRSAVQ